MKSRSKAVLRSSEIVHAGSCTFRGGSRSINYQKWIFQVFQMDFRS
jgi:hypothetical protein